MKFDHDFVGREALEAMGDEPKRRKVTLAWNGEDVARAMGTLFEKGDAAKYIDLPLSNYATWPHDKVLHDGEMVGVSTFSGYSYNERSMLSLGYVDVDVPSRRRGDARVGRGGRRVGEAGRRAPPAGGDPRRRQPVPVLRGRAHVVPRGVAHEGRGGRGLTPRRRVSGDRRSRSAPGVSKCGPSGRSRIETPILSARIAAREQAAIGVEAPRVHSRHEAAES